MKSLTRTWGSVRVDEKLSWDNVVAKLEMGRECEGVGDKKVNTKVGTTIAGLPTAWTSMARNSGTVERVNLWLQTYLQPRW